MKGLRILGALLVFGNLGAGAAWATDYETMQGRLKKFATTTEDAFTRPRGLCVCQDGNVLHGKAGALVQHDGDPNRVTVVCLVMTYLDGTLFSGTHCPTFQVLAK